jgi:hypothetical protein
MERGGVSVADNFISMKGGYMNKIPPELYMQYRRLILHQAQVWSRKTKFDFRELVSFGNLILCECYNKWDGERDFTTFLVSILNYKFRSVIWGSSISRPQYNNNTDILQAVGDTRTSAGISGDIIDNYVDPVKALTKGMPEDCKRLVQIILRHELKSLSSLSYHLRKRGWSWKTINQRIKETKTFFKQRREAQ